MRAFEYDALPGRVVFGVGAWDKVPEELDRMGAERALLITSAGRRALADDLADRLGARCVGIVANAVSHVPVELVEAAQARARETRADCVIGMGGGAPVGLAKATPLGVDVKLMAVPTTYAGSEMTAVIGITRDGVKRQVADLRVLPQVVVYDPALTTGLPARATATTGMNAMAHCVEALYAEHANPVASVMAEAAIGSLSRALPRCVRTPDDLAARGEALYGAYLAGVAIGNSGVAIHHKACHVLGGTHGLAHGDANTVILPHATRFNEQDAADAIGTVARALGGEDAAGRLFDLAVEMGAPTSLKELGLDEGALDDIADQVLAAVTFNPRPLDFAGVRAMLGAAYHGRRP